MCDHRGDSGAEAAATAFRVERSWIVTSAPPKNHSATKIKVTPAITIATARWSSTRNST